MLQNFPSRGIPLTFDASLVNKSSSRLSSSQRPKRQKQIAGTNTTRKLVLSSSSSFAQPSALSEQYFTTTLNALNSALDKIFHDKPISSSLEFLYRGVESLCRADKARSIWDNLKLQMRDHIVEDFLGDELIKLTRTIEENGIDSSYNNMAEIIEILWNRWMSQLNIVKNMFFYLDRSYLLNSPNELSIWDAGIDLFRKHIIQHPIVSNQLMASLMIYFENNRSGKYFDTEKISVVIKMLSTVGVYSGIFHSKFIDSTKAHYSKLANEKIEAIPVSEYLQLVSKWTEFEAEQASSVGLDRVTRAEAIACVKNEMVRNEIDTLIDLGFDHMLESDDLKSLSLMYDLFSQISEEKALVASWSEYIRKEGQKLVMDPSKDAVMVTALLEFKDKLDNIVITAFQNNDLFGHALRESFEYFINKRQNTPAEMIAKYLDQILRAGNKQLEDTELDDRMKKVLILFRFINGKDVFEAFYKKDLAKRLLLNKSASDDAERNMLLLLKTECGMGFTQKLEGMFKDIEISKDFMASFKDSKHSSSRREGGIDLFVNALSQAFWPSYPDVRLMLPPDMAEALESFKTFYLTKQTGRNLSWRHSLGHCVVKANLPKGKKELSMSLFQTVVLLLFNDITDGKTLSYEEIKTGTALEDKELARTLQSLACGKIRVLSKEPKGKEINPGDKFKVNLKLEDKAYRLRINQIQLKETPEENKDTHEQVQRDRQYEIQACIIRIMKSVKTISHVELIRQTIDQTKNRGTLDLADIKKNIEKLIDKEYIERQDKNTYVYLA
ncbi:Cullin family-domain-containing protein [Dipodascopsis uninucleata]